MSQENVEVVQRFVEHWNETGEPPWDELDTAEVFDQFRYEVDELVDLGDSILALMRIRVRGVQSGAMGTQSGAAVIQLRDGMIVSYRSYLRREDALEAVGLQA